MMMLKQKTKPNIDQEESRQKLGQMQRLYEAGNLSLQALGAFFGMSRQAVSERFKKAGVKVRAQTGGRALRLITKEDLEDLYAVRKLTMPQVAAHLKTSSGIVARELARHGIEKRSKCCARRKTPQLWELKQGESLTIERPSGVKNIYRNLHAKARQIGIKISVRKIGENSFEITRLFSA